METITKYKAADGSEWNNPEDAEAREDMIRDVEHALNWLKPTPDDLNWKGYVQQPEEMVRKCREDLFSIANQEGVLKWWIDSQLNEHGTTKEELIHNAHPSWFGRMLDGGHEPLAKGYTRLCCIDSQLREWNQPYYAMNPGTGELTCVG